LAQQMGITSPLDPFTTLTLGTSPVTPLEIAVAYSTIARQGTYVQPAVITRVEWPDGRVDTFPQERRQAVDPGQAVQVISALRRVVGNGTGVSATLPVPAAGKTGTTGNYLDAWFVGFTPNAWTAAVWMGYPNPPGQPPQFMTNVHGRQVTGGSFPAQIWRRFMERWIEGVPMPSFPSVSGYPGRILNEGIDTTTTLPPTTPPPPTPAPTAPTTPALPACGSPPTTTDPTQPCVPG
jgi:membrane peptidoglycan carboxypeptidase